MKVGKEGRKFESEAQRLLLFIVIQSSLVENSSSYRCSASPEVYWALGPVAVPSSAHQNPCALETGSHSSLVLCTGPG